MNTNKNHRRIKRVSMAPVLFVLAGLISGCATVQPNKADHDWQDLFSLLNHKAKSNTTHITLADGSSHRAMDLAAAADTFRWRDARGHAHKHAFAEIVFVDFGRASISFTKRMSIGLLTGAAAGAGLGYSQGDPDEFLVDRPLQTASYAIGGAALGAAAGALWGAADSDVERFVINDPASYEAFRRKAVSKAKLDRLPEPYIQN